MTTMRDKTMPPRDGRRPGTKVGAFDQEYEEWRRAVVYSIYGRQWDKVPNTKRGRALRDG